MKEWIELYIQKKQSPDTKKVSEFCFLNYIILQTISIIRMATDELPCSAKWLIRLLTLNSHKFPYLPSSISVHPVLLLCGRMSSIRSLRSQHL
ncbi:hypothetical protein F3F42_25415 [Bacteroides ovatus]|nr:hypothetical protein F3F42_25415 [Bacteroides ovatus]KAA3914830.1 hypothetical protein F3D73_21090 [Bacteroides ovatus]